MIKPKHRTRAWIIVWFALVTIIVGYFNWTILIPIQDFGTMTEAEVLRAQQEFALNYPHGRFLLYVGFGAFIPAALYLLITTLKTTLKRNV